MSLQQLLSILRARWPAAALILLASLAASLAWSLLRPASYLAQVPVMVDVQASDVGGGYAPALLSSYIATQIDVARSDAVAERAKQLLQSGDASGPDAALTVPALQAGQTVRPARESHIIHMQWRGPDAAQVARVANALARAFVDVSLSLKTGPARQDAGWLEQQVGQAREGMSTAQMRLADYQRSAGIVGGEQSDHELARLNQLATRLAQVQAETTDAQSKQGALGDTLPEVMDSPLVNGLKADLARLEARRQEASASLGPRHPQMERLDAEVASLRARLSAETRRVSGSVEARWHAGQQRERQLAAAMNSQRERVLAINHDRARMALLQQDVDTARRQFEQVSTHASRSRLQSLATQADLVLLSPATAPAEATGPSWRQALAVGGVAGLLLAVAGALMMELSRRRVRSVDDLMQVTGLRVLASLPAAHASGGGGRNAALPPSARRLGLAGGGAA